MFGVFSLTHRMLVQRPGKFFSLLRAGTSRI